MTALTLGIVPSSFVIEHLPHTTLPEDDDWIALVRAPEGLTVVRDAAPWAEAERWTGLYATGHDLDAPGLLASVVAPLAEADVPVFVASTFHGDLVLTPERLRKTAVSALEAAGHRVLP
ncbi:ACT domain-containing protein [Actinocorallia libanotica]|uniref:ACT domain-containing protein n=1 Tax=Actinocorallia libanotica TaxID=46162 RepID=A0ABN1QF51_9ACTN